MDQLKEEDNDVIEILSDDSSSSDIIIQEELATETISIEDDSGSDSMKLPVTVEDVPINCYNDLEKFVEDLDKIICTPIVVKKEMNFFDFDTFVINVVTDDDIKYIAKLPRDKIKCTVHGTCCHQCKEITLDTKSFCHNPTCTDNNGLLCGPCLRLRYGENLATALKDNTWVCPYCRGICNCPPCRALAGKLPAENLVFVALALGFKSVRHFLKLQKD